MTEPGDVSFASEPVIGVPGPLTNGWDKQLDSCVVDQSVGLPDVATLSFRDPDHTFLDKFGIKIGTDVTVSATTIRGQDLLFTGEVTALELDSVNTQGSFTVVRAQSKAHRLFRGRKVVAFENLSASAIVQEVAKGAGLTTGRIDTAAITYQLLSQANVSDWEFLLSIAQEHGVTLRVDQKTQQLEMVKPNPAASAPDPSSQDSTNPYLLRFGGNLIALRAALTEAEQVDDIEVRGWDVETATKLVSTVPVSDSTTVVPGMKVPKPKANTKLIVADTPYRTAKETTTAAGSIAAAASAMVGEIEAVVRGDTRLQVGVPVALGTAGPEFSGKYTTTATHHSLGPHGYRTTVVASASPDRSLAGLVMGGNAPARGPRIPGLAIGVVTDTKEPGVKERGWVRLKFPWLSDSYVTDWVRTVQFGGKGGGGVFSPEVNDEVLVGFEQGSLDAPYVLGGLYNGVDLPTLGDVPLVDGTSGKVNRRSFASRSGQVMELLDVDGGPTGVRLATGDGQFEIRLDEHGRQITVSALAGRSGAALSQIVLNKDGITVDAGKGTLTLKGGTIAITGTTVAINGTAEASLAADIVRIN